MSEINHFLQGLYGSFYPAMLEEGGVEDDVEPRLIVPKRSNKRGSTVIRLIKRGDQQEDLDDTSSK